MYMVKHGIYPPLFKVLIRENIVVLLHQVVVSHGLLDTGLVGGNHVWDGLDELPLLCEVLDAVGTVVQVLGDLTEVVTDLHE